MWITWLLIIVVLIWTYQRRIRRATFVKSVKPKQEPELERLYQQFKDRFVSSDDGILPAEVEQVYCICSDQRKEYIQNQLMRFGLGITYFKGIFPEDLTLKEYNTLSCTNKNMCTIYKKNTKLPVQLSFVMCMMDAIKKGHKTIIIFEDDIIINVDRDTLNESLKEFAASSYEMFYMGYCMMSCNQEFDKTQYKYIVEVPDKHLVCHHAIAMKTTNFRKILDFLFPMMETKDRNFRTYFKKFGTQVCVPKFSYFDQERTIHGSMNENSTRMDQTCDLTE